MNLIKILSDFSIESQKWLTSLPESSDDHYSQNDAVEDIENLYHLCCFFESNKILLEKNYQDYLSPIAMLEDISRFLGEEHYFEEAILTRWNNQQNNRKANKETEIVYEHISQDNESFKIICPMSHFAQKYWGNHFYNNIDHFQLNEKSFLVFKKNLKIKIRFDDEDSHMQLVDDNNITIYGDNDKYLWNQFKNIFLPISYFWDIGDFVTLNDNIGDFKTWKNILSFNGHHLEFLPESLKCPELYHIAIKNDGTAIKHVPQKEKTFDICKMAVETHGTAIQYIPREYMELGLTK